jgi:hypothetical protein
MRSLARLSCDQVPDTLAAKQQGHRLVECAESERDVKRLPRTWALARRIPADDQHASGCVHLGSAAEADEAVTAQRCVHELPQPREFEALAQGADRQAIPRGFARIQHTPARGGSHAGQELHTVLARQRLPSGWKIGLGGWRYEHDIAVCRAIAMKENAGYGVPPGEQGFRKAKRCQT